jgi:hypothetical protein
MSADTFVRVGKIIKSEGAGTYSVRCAGGEDVLVQSLLGVRLQPGTPVMLIQAVKYLVVKRISLDEYDNRYLKLQ